jgi:probable phosphoglycerate mutase
MTDHTLYLLRHGETEFNIENRLQGQQDSPLTPRGRSQARGHGALLATLIVDPAVWRVVASPLGRTMNTARLTCAEFGLPETAIESDPRLMEIAYGEWEGLTYDEIETRYQDEWAARQRDPWQFVVPGGESYAMVAARVATFLDEIERDTIVVSHGGTGRVLRGLYARLAPTEIKTLEQPQDALHRLTQGTIARIDHGASGEASIAIDSAPSRP